MTKVVLTQEVKEYIKKRVAYEIGKYFLEKEKKYTRDTIYKPLFGTVKNN